VVKEPPVAHRLGPAVQEGAAPVDNRRHHPHRHHYLEHDMSYFRVVGVKDDKRDICPVICEDFKTAEKLGFFLAMLVAPGMKIEIEEINKETRSVKYGTEQEL
jgi:hypothetical protein